MSSREGAGSHPDRPGRRSPTFRPDRVTELKGSVGYYGVFVPTIAPFKRVSALDTVVLAEDGRTPVLGVGSLDTVAVPVEGVEAPPPDDRPRDRFWGSVVLDFTSGMVVPLPSVSPESRILTQRTEPESLVGIEIDAAGNFFAVGRVVPASKLVRLTFLTDAPRTYFNAPTPLPDARSDALAGDLAPLPNSVLRRAETFLTELSLYRGMPLSVALPKLTEHFRAFEESAEPPRDSGDIFLDLSRGGRGVCRHRAYGFMIAALALGIPTRFVQNEAHAWVEVELPHVGSVRIDLGGSARGLQPRNLDNRPVYRPESSDPLPRPEAYRRAYAEAARRQAGHQSTGGSSQGPPRPASGSGPAVGSNQGTGLNLIVDRTRYQVFRGRSLTVTGRAVAGVSGIAGLRVEVALRGGQERLLGVTVTDEQGYYRGTFGVPLTAPVGEYQLVVRTPGNEEYPAAVAR